VDLFRYSGSSLDRSNVVLSLLRSKLISDYHHNQKFEVGKGSSRRRDDPDHGIRHRYQQRTPASSGCQRQVQEASHCGPATSNRRGPEEVVVRALSGLAVSKLSRRTYLLGTVAASARGRPAPASAWALAAQGPGGPCP
jgi:hypothetical protein